MSEHQIMHYSNKKVKNFWLNFQENLGNLEGSCQRDHWNGDPDPSAHSTNSPSYHEFGGADYPCQVNK
jgi:hypothetical protein